MFFAFRLLAMLLAIGGIVTGRLLYNDPVLCLIFTQLMAVILWVQLMIVERRLERAPAGSEVQHR